MNRLLIKYRRVLIIAVHLLLVVAAYIGAYLIRFDFNLTPDHRAKLLQTLPFVILIKMPVFFYLGIFVGLWRYVSIGDVWQIFKAVTASTVLFILSIVFLLGHVGFPRSIFILDWLLSLTLITGIRAATRIIRENYKPEAVPNPRKVLIVGAGQAGILMLKEIRSNPGMGMEVVGLIDDDPAKKYHSIGRKRILGNRHAIPAVVKKYGIEEIILAIPSAKGETIRDILSICRITGVKIKTVPRLDRLLSGDLQLKPREVRAEDLLGREPVEVNQEEIRSYIKGRRVLVTGAGGSIGSEICIQIAGFLPSEMILLDHNENNVYFLVIRLKQLYPAIRFRTMIGDIKDISLLKYLFSSYRPQLVFHCAAHKHVPLMQENPSAAVKNNVLGTRNLIYAANHYGVERFVLISTDKAVNPINIMGISKRIAEMILQAKAKNSRTKFMAVRFGNVLGSDGSVVPLFLKQIAEGGPITVTHPEARRYFMSIPEAVSLVLQAAAMGKGGEIFILDMGEQVKIIDLARNLIAFSGLRLDKDISIKFTGLRDGEKLSEELMLNTEKDLATKNQKIYVTQPNNFDPIRLRRQIRELEHLATIMDNERVVRKMKEILPRNG